MGEPTPPDIEQILDSVRGLLVQWRQTGTLGEVAVIVGGNQYELQERPVRRHKPVKRHSRVTAATI